MRDARGDWKPVARRLWVGAGLARSLTRRLSGQQARTRTPSRDPHPQRSRHDLELERRAQIDRLANQQWETVKKEDWQNQELLALSRETLDLLRSQSDRAPDPHGRRPDGETPG